MYVQYVEVITVIIYITSHHRTQTPFFTPLPLPLPLTDRDIQARMEKRKEKREK